MATAAIRIEHVWKNFRLYHERNQYLKAAMLRGRRARYEEFWALRDVSLEIPHGATFGIIGSNGSGKSTMLKCLASILIPDKGSIAVSGRLAALLELGAGFHPELTGRENVFLNGAILGMTKRDITRRFDDIVAFAGLEQFIDTPVKNYSSGMTVRLGFAIAANVEPEILLIDEVLSVGDAVFQRRCAEKIEEFRQEGRTIVFVSHSTDQVVQLCETAAWIEKGELAMLGPSTEVVGRYTGASHSAVVDDGEGHGQRWGSGEAQIVSVQVLDHAGRPTGVLTTGEPATIRVEVSAHSPIQDPVLGLRIDHLHGLPLWGTNTRRRGETIGWIDGAATFEFGVDAIPFLDGVYDLSVALTDHTENHAFDHWEKRVRFEVRQHQVYDIGTAYVAGTWTIAHLSQPRRSRAT